MANIAPLFISIEQPLLTDADRARLNHSYVGGIVLFTKNFTSQSQIKSLIAEIRALKSALLICVDHEGGRVQRFRDGFTRLPPMHCLGEIYDANPALALQYAQACGVIMGTELGEIGVDFSFTPVLDLDYGQNTVIGDRSFHADPQIIIALAGSLIQGLQQTGMAAIGKHFPGHGFVAKDSHLELPQDPRSWDALAQADLVPFQQLQSKLAGIMTAHVQYQAIDPNIATFSPFWLKQILRDQLNYRGVIFSDDLLMKALDVIGDIRMRAQLALVAGCDVLLVCNNNAAVDILLNDNVLQEYSQPIDDANLRNHFKSDPASYQAATQLLSTLSWQTQAVANDVVGKL